ncbi:SpvB/TcaC N-terminal domain-containing protein [Niastella sp. OAS944]|uniref:SpvB/TcaC N-terminal domain-containing protein n=1 Tax=Niastella sp. OAS944 TaxID=2664089 RepID=UPI00347A555D|nr:RHS repeat-associated protein [Chitinophagaceae bacterium OAS944]
MQSEKKSGNQPHSGGAAQSQHSLLSTGGGKTKSNAIEIPSVSLPKGGGALKGIDEKFSVNAVNGTAGFSIPLPVSPARGVTPSLSLGYNSGGGNGIFGLGWNHSLASIKRKTDKQLPQYFDAEESDIFLFSEMEDLVPEFDRNDDGTFKKNGDGYVIKERDSADNLYTRRFYKPRTEGAFARIERWLAKDGSEIKWRVISKENIITLFGWSANSRLSEPGNAQKVYEWLPEFVFDDKGNCCKYIYRKEDEAGIDSSLIHNKNRLQSGAITYASLYLEKALYGNKTPYKQFGDVLPANGDFLFETVFDYGTLQSTDSPDTLNEWDYRPDAFSEYKAGFEIRTTRLCKRVLLFHHFTGASEYDGLVNSLNFEYNTSKEQGFTFLQSITSVGYIKKADGTYSAKRLPAVEFEYQQHEWSSNIRTVSTEAMVNAPAGIEQPPYQFTDLFNEGLSGILSEQAGGWFYKHNLGVRKSAVTGEEALLFENAKLVSPKPSFQGLGSQMQLADLDADGGKQLVNYNTSPTGFFELNDDNEWLPFLHFRQLPNINFNDPYSHMIDLNGDGKPELLVSEDNSFTWYESAGRDGFAAAKKTIKPGDEEAGAQVVFADEKQTIFLADMSGDGLTDIVRIRNGEVCYWPNLGYGRFGKKVAMDGAPQFDQPDAFNPAFIRLTDIDGSGTADLIYLGKNTFSCWMNLNGNRFAATPFEIEAFPEIHSAAKITVTDLLGNGVACIVWSSPLTKDANAALQYIDLMNSKKPHILVGYKNNMGKEVSLEYTPSTKFYIDDKLAGNQWITKLHFPVHCVSKSIMEDKITGHKFTSTFKYHHGYYDHAEREFRGFGMVEQTDAETFEHWVTSGATNITDATLHQEPVITKNWYHTGAFLRNDTILAHFEHDYWYNEMARQGFPVTHHEKQLDDARIVPGKGIAASYLDHLSAEEYQQAMRACKSMALRSEVFAHDAIKFGNTTDAIKKQLTPYNVASHNCVIELLQPKGTNRYAVFIVKESEAITYSYERDTQDPRIAHTLNISLDEYGNILESASVVYPRLIADATLPAETQSAQNTTSISYTLINYTGDVFSDTSNRQRLPAETKTFELKGVTKTGTYYDIQNFENILLNVKSDAALYHEINKLPAAGKALRRLIEHAKTLYYKNDLTGALPLYALESKAISFENYQLAYTPELLQDIYGAKVNAALMTEGKFTHSKDILNNDDVNWWVRSGTMQYIEGTETFTDAQNRFYMPVSYTGPFGAISKVKYYGSYFLMIGETEDALANKNTVLAFNFRTLAPKSTKDANDNISEVLQDELGLVKAMAVLGKGNQADDLTGLQEHTEAAEATLIQNFFNPPVTPQGITNSVALMNTGLQLLQNATNRFIYDLDVYKNTGKPVVTAAVVRETHNRDEQGNLNPQTKLQVSFEYASGSGAVVMKKVQAEPGVAKRVRVMPGNTVLIDEIDTTPLLRWIGNGKTIVNNKGNAVKQYEPYFSISNQYEDVKELVETGVTPVMYYDAAGRLVRTDMPDGSFVKVVFNNWKQLSWDANDTVKESDWYKKRTDNTRPDFITDTKEQQAAVKAALHAGTPGQLHLDSQGRPVFSVEHNKNITTLADEFYKTRINLDIEGNLHEVTDARNNTVMEFKYDMLGNKVYQKSMDTGRRWLLTNILGNSLRTWDDRNHEFQFEYDILHRPLQSIVKGGDGSTPLNHIFDRIFYGEAQPNPQVKNLRGQVYRRYDTGGSLEMTDGYDFKGKPVLTKRKLFNKYKEVANWTNPNMLTDLEADEFVFTTTTDALGRITKQIAPDGSIITPSYNEAGLLNAETVQHIDPAETVTYIKNIDYNEKGQRSKIVYGNDVTTRLYYDKDTFRLKRLESKRMNNDPLQDWYYTFDPVGNITHIEDKNIPIAFFDNQKVTGISEYSYDAIYRLIEANGRENNVAVTFNNQDNWNDNYFMQDFNAGDPVAMRNYMQKYQYDEVGNIVKMEHTSIGNNWIRNYNYNLNNNRLLSTQVGTNTYNYDYHPQHGFTTAMPHLEELGWNFKEELVRTISQKRNDGGTPEITYYQYDGSGRRIRKITENQAAPGVSPSKKEERIYIAGYELYKKHSGTHSGLQRVSLSLLDGGQRFVTVETRNNVDDGTEKKLIRYSLTNYLGSVAMELNETAEIINYEEFHPFGTTAFEAKSKTIKAAAKRYRYTGMERDEETGLEYHGARYYEPWLGRWLNADPGGMIDGVNVYCYSRNAPLNKVDKNGMQSSEPSNWNRFVGGLRMVGGGFEMVAGAGLFSAGVATSEFGIGLAGIAGGAVVVGHGADTAGTGLAMLISGRDIDTLTSQGLQEAGLTRTQANLADAGIGIVGTLGASAATKAPGLAAEGIRLSEPSITVSHAAGAPSAAGLTNPMGYAIGHTRVGVTLGDGSATVWSHLTVPATGRATMSGGTLVESGNALISTGENLAPKFASMATVPVTAEEANAALTAMRAAAPEAVPLVTEGAATVTTSSGVVLTAAEASKLGEAGVTVGSAGNYALFTNDCASYGSTLLQSGGVAASGTTPSTLFLSAALRSEAPLTTILTSPLVSNSSAMISTVAHGADAAATTVSAISSGDSSASSGMPNAANFASYDAFSAAVRGPYSQDAIMEAWASVHGWVSN